MKKSVKTVWIVTREYAGIAEAGGVKNVACSLAEGLVRQGKQVCVIIPRYRFVATDSSFLFSSTVAVSNHVYPLTFSSAIINGVHIIFIESELYLNKHAVYVYTDQESKSIPGAVRGKGHFDVDIMNMILQKAVLQYALITGTVPDVLHCQDAHTAILPALARTDPVYCRLFSKTALAVTIHNAGPGYRQAIPYSENSVMLTGLDPTVLEKALFNGNIEPFLLAAEYSRLTTVSPWYAKELTSNTFNEFSEGLSGEFERRGVKITGITNGIDYEKYQTQDIGCSQLPYAFDPSRGDLEGKYRCRKFFLDRIADFPEVSGLTCFGTLEDVPHAVYYSYHGRIAWQKGLDVLERSAKIVLDALPQARFIILGQGDPALESILISLAHEYTGRFVYIRGYERSLARMAVAVSDFLVLPSLFEPCGLEDLIGQIFGTIPVAHAVGGLQKIIHGESGFLYKGHGSENEVSLLADLLIEIAAPIVASDRIGCSGVPCYLGMIQYSSTIHVRETYSWDSIIRHHYIPLYERNLIRPA
jgi:starch synthase